MKFSNKPPYVARRRALLVVALVAAAFVLAGGQFGDPRIAGSVAITGH